MTSHSEQLLRLGRSILVPYSELPGAVCTIITGSAAEGLADEFSDLDMIVYYASMPDEQQIRSIRQHIGGGPLTWSVGAHADGEFGEGFRVQGVDCQICHTTLARWEADIARVLCGDEVATPLHKAMSGTLLSIAVSGPELLEKWKDRLQGYSDALVAAMVERHLQFFPIWGVLARLERRDASLWIRQVLVESSFNLLGVLAGLNRQFFTPFQFKRAHAFMSRLRIAPPRLAERLDAIWKFGPEESALELRELVRETVELVRQQLPQIDTGACEAALNRCDRPWAKTEGA